MRSSAWRRRHQHTAARTASASVKLIRPIPCRTGSYDGPPGTRPRQLPDILTCREQDWPGWEISCRAQPERVTGLKGIILRYDSDMSDRKSRLTITVDPDLSSYAERLVESGQAASVSAAFNEAMAEKAYRDRRRRSLWKARSDQADPGRVARMMDHVDQQLTGE